MTPVWARAGLSLSSYMHPAQRKPADFLELSFSGQGCRVGRVTYIGRKISPIKRGRAQRGMARRKSQRFSHHAHPAALPADASERLWTASGPGGRRA